MIVFKLIFCMLFLTGYAGDGLQVKKMNLMEGSIRPSLSVKDLPASVVKFSSPAEGKQTMNFGKCKHPVTGKSFTHQGIDIAAPAGTEIKASLKGKVMKVVVNVVKGKRGARGKFIIVEHTNGYETLYSHLSKVLVKKGDTVLTGQKIAEMGSTGYSTGNHLHFEIRKDGKYINPSKLLGK